MRFKQVCHLNSVKFLGKRKKNTNTQRKRNRQTGTDRKTETDKDKRDKVNKGQKERYICVDSEEADIFSPVHSSSKS